MKTRIIARFLCVAGIALPGVSPLRAQTATYNDNFDADTAGVLPSGWTGYGTNPFTVITTNVVSGTHALGQASPHDGDYCIYTAATPFGNGYVGCSELVEYSGSQITCNECLVLSCDSQGKTYYLANPQWGGHAVAFFKVANGNNYTQIGTSQTIPTFAAGTAVYTKFYRSGGQLSYKVWAVGSSEPASVSATASAVDSSPLPTGYPGVWLGYTSGSTVPADDFSYYAAPVVAAGYQVTPASTTMVQGSATACTLSTSPAGGTESSADTVTFSDGLTPAGTFSPATQAFTAAGATSYPFTYTPPATYTGSVTLKATSADGLTAGTATATVIQPPVVYAAGNALIHYSPYQWHVSAASASEMETNNSGSSLTLNVSGCTSFAVNFDVGSPVVANALLRVRVDTNVVTNTTVPAGGAYTVTLPSSGAHTVAIQFPYLTQASDRWVTPASVVRLVNVTLPYGASLSAVTGLPAGKLLVYGDSRGEAAQLSDVFASFGYFLSQTLGLEMGDRSFGSMGWTKINVPSGSSAAGDIVPEYTPGNEAQSAWDKYDSSHPLLVGGLYSPQPAAILDLLGINSALGGETDASVTASITGLLTAQRAAAGPACNIFLSYDFSGYERNATLAGYNAYMQATSDPHCYLIDPGTVAGLANGGASYLAGDGIHPNALGHAIVGSLVSGSAQNALKVRAGLSGFFF